MRLLYNEIVENRGRELGFVFYKGGKKMERDRSSKIIAIIAVFVAIVGLSLGFAAFTRTLVIQSSAAIQPGDDTFSVKLSSISTSVDTTASKIAVDKSETATDTKGTIAINNTGNPSISGLGATFTKPGEYVTYTFYAVNDGEYDAFLKSIKIANATDGSHGVECSAKDSTDPTMVANACKGIKMTVTVATNKEATATFDSTVSNDNITATSITKSALENKNSHTVVVKLEYLADSAIADGSFDVKFGTVSLKYSSQDVEV